MKKFGINTLTNVSAKIWSIVSIYIFIPLYIKILGETSYGLVSVFATLQTAMNVMGLGLSNTLRREFASGDRNDSLNNIRKYKLLRSIESIYWVIGTIIVLICFLGSDFIANDWLNIEGLNANLVSKVIFLMGISIALQLVSNLYAGCLFGLDYQVRANIYCISWSISKSLGALLIIMFVDKNLEYFYLWHIFTDVCYLLVLRITIKRKCPCNEKWGIRDLSNLKTIWKYAVGILFISFIALINRQLDKIIISKFLSITEFGAYNVATTLGSLTAIIPSAVYVSVFPRFTLYATTGKKDLLYNSFMRINRCVNIVIACMGSYIAVYATSLIYIWTGSEIYVNSLQIVGTLVVLAISILEFQEIPYALALAHGNTKINILVGVVFLPIIVGTTYYGISKYGLLGAGIFYVLMMIGQSMMLIYLVVKKYLNKNYYNIILKDTLMPYCISFIIAFISREIIGLFNLNYIIQGGLAVIFGLCTLIGLSLCFGIKDSLLELKNEEEGIVK